VQGDHMSDSGIHFGAANSAQLLGHLPDYLILWPAIRPEHSSED
jgi:hypothetical protein